MKPIHISKTDYRKLSDLIQWEVRPHTRLPEHLQALEGELNRAEIRDLSEMEADIITLHSTARLKDLDTGEIVEYTLAFPEEADIDAGRISILAPLGTAMLGYRKGDSFEWQVPAGVSRWQVEDVFFHEDAAGPRQE
jgi:regulator of nucleoside diphosphate kinase